MTLQELDVLGTWVAGLGTFAAVVVSLYLARKQGKINLRAHVGERVIIETKSENRPDVVVINIANCSSRPANITNIAWQLGWFRKKYFIQLLNIPGYDTVPKLLQEGEEVSFIIPYEFPGGEENWDDSSAKMFLEGVRFPWLYLQSFKCVISTSVGQQFKINVESNLKSKLLQKNKANKSIQPTANASAD